MRPLSGRLARRLTIPFLLLFALLGGFLISPAGAAPPATLPLRLDQVQVIGSHNSFHIEPSADKIEFYKAFYPDAVLLQYSHAPLGEQFEHEGVRQIELDIWADPNGDLWRPLGVKGYKVFHIEVFDEDSTCLTLIDCLNAVKSWSDAHQAHMPIMIQLEIHDQASFPGLSNPIFVDSALFDQMDAELRSVFAPERLITPDDVRGAHSTLRDAVTTDGWPLIDSSRGKVMFTLDNKHDDYVAGHPSLQGRVAFAPANNTTDDDAAFLKLNDPTGVHQAEITSVVQQGFMVRTRADDPVTTAQSGDTTQRDAALASGGHWVSTDYPVPGISARWGTNYVASIPGGTPARCNPVTAPPGCVNTAIENLPPTPTTSTTAAPTSTSPSTSPTTTRAVAVASPVVATPRFTG